jgi:hypothetical protein
LCCRPGPPWRKITGTGQYSVISLFKNSTYREAHPSLRTARKKSREWNRISSGWTQTPLCEHIR